VREVFSAGWLALREPFDAAARGVALGERFAAALPERPVIMDLGAGTGSLLRWLAPRIGGDQAWLLVDGDAALLEEAIARIARWGAGLGFRVRGRGGLALSTPGGEWLVRTRRADLADLAGLGAGAADAVVCSALLDLVSAAWIAGLAAQMRGPVLACLNADGRDAMLPADAGDAVVRAGFRRDQARDKGFGPAVGRHAEAALRKAFGAPRWRVVAASTPWRIPATAGAMLEALVEGHAGAAARWMPAARGTIAAWERRRLRQVAAGRLAMRIGHRDVLVLPSS
jgi:hypothetical protein